MDQPAKRRADPSGGIATVEASCSTRPGRNGKAVADWVLDKAQARIGADYDLIDLADHPLPHMDEPMSPATAVRTRPPPQL